MRRRNTRMAKRSRNAPAVRIAACTQSLRAIGKAAPGLAQSTRNRLHAIAQCIDDMVDLLLPPEQREAPHATMAWTHAPQLPRIDANAQVLALWPVATQ